MKLKRIIAGITACTIVGSTILTMPISAKTTTKAENVSLSDLLNTAKMAVNLKDNLTAEKQAEILDKFDTNGNGQISISELLAVAQRVARTDESDIVNEYGTADSEETTETTIETSEVTTTEETSETTETTVETTETTEETTTTTEVVAFNPVIEIDGTEYKDGDNFVAKVNEIYEVNATDAENEITVSLTGSQDDNENNLVRVSENRFEVIKDGTLTITVKSADGQQKTITLNIKVGKSLEEADLENLCISYLYDGENYYSDDYKNFSNEIGEDVSEEDIFEEDADKAIIEDPEQYWNEVENYRRYEKISGGTIYIGIGGKLEIKGFAIRSQNDKDNYDYEDYDTNDKITYISTDANKVTIDENGVIKGIAHTDTSVEIIVMVNGKEFSRFKVYVGNSKYSIIEITGEKYVLDNEYRTTEDSLYDYYEYQHLVEGKYVENASQGEVLSLKDLQNQVGAENVRSISAKEFDGSEMQDMELSYIKGLMYYMDTATSTIYYAITNETGQGQFRIDFGNPSSGSGGTILYVKVLDMEQYKKYQAEQAKTEAFTVEFYGKKIATVTADDTKYYYGSSSIPPTIYIAEGETLNLSDIVKVSGVDNPKITVTNSQNGTSAQNLEYDILTKTFTALELTEENSGTNNLEKITLSYTVSDGTTRTIEFYVLVAESVFGPSYQFSLQRNDSGKYYCTAEQLEYLDGLLFLVDADGYLRTPYCKLTVDNKKMFSVTETKNEYGSYDSLSLADGYEPKAGDTATITATASYGGDSIIFSPNFKAITYTVEVVDTLPEISRTLASDTFEYPEDNKSNQDITFENIVEIKNLKDGYKVVPVVTEASDNVGYIDIFGEEYNLSGMTVDATGIEVVEEANGRYSISGIKVASASKVRDDTYICVGLAVFDADGNFVSASGELIYLYIKGEKPVEITFENTMSLVESTDNKTAIYTMGDLEDYEFSQFKNLKVTDENGTTIGTAEINTTGLYVTFNEAVEQNEVRNFKIDIPVFKEYGQHYFAKRTVTVSLTAENPSPTFKETTVFEDNGSVTYTLKDSNGWKIKGDEFTFDYKDGSASTTYMVKIKDGTSLTFVPAFYTSDKEAYVVPVTFEKNGVTVSRKYNLTALKSPKIELEKSVVEVDENGTATFNVDSDDGWTMNTEIPEGAEQLKDLLNDAGSLKFSFNPELSAGQAKTREIIVEMVKEGIGKRKTFTITAFKAPEITLPEKPITVIDSSQPIQISIPFTINGGDDWEITPNITDSSIGYMISFERNGDLMFNLKKDFTGTETMPVTFSCSKQLDENTTLSATKEVVVTLIKTGEDSGDDVDGEDGGDISLS